MHSTEHTLTLQIPADARQLVTARVFAESVGRLADMGKDRILELKVVVSDITTWMLIVAPPEGAIVIRATIADGDIRVAIEPIGFPMPKERDMGSLDFEMWSLDLVRTFTEEMNVGSGITFSFNTTD